MSRAGPFLDFDPDPEVWLVGPTETRPVDEWIPAATELMVGAFGLTEEQQNARELVGEILASTARAHPSELAYYVLRWSHPAEVPLPLFIGMVPRDEVEDLDLRWLAGEGSLTVEQPVVDELVAPPGTTVRRSLPYSLAEDRTLVVGARYVVDTGHPEVLVFAHTASGDPSDVLKAQDDIEKFLATVTVADHVDGDAG